MEKSDSPEKLGGVVDNDKEEEEEDQPSSSSGTNNIVGSPTQIGDPLTLSFTNQFTYKDPQTHHEFTWDDERKKWIPKGGDSGEGSSDVKWDEESGSYVYTDKDGVVYEWRKGEDGREGWFPKDNRIADDNNASSTSPSPPSPPPASSTSGFNNPNYTSNNPNQDPRRFYYATLSPTSMGVNNEPVLFLSPDDQANNNIQEGEEPLPLPSGWERHEDSTGPYYWHIKSGTIQREPPTSSSVNPNPALLIPSGSFRANSNTTMVKRSQTVSSNLSQTSSSSEKRKSWSQCLSEDQRRSLSDEDELRYSGVSLGCLAISEEDLTPERSSRAVSKVIAELTNHKPNLEVAGKIWGGGNELYLELDESHLRVKIKEKDLVVLEQPIHSIRVWGVGREDPRSFAFVAREKQTRQFLCHVFRLDFFARPLANSLRDACKKIMIERQMKQKRPTTLPTGVRKNTTANPSLFPTPMDEPRKVIKAYYLGAKYVKKPTGMDTLNGAIDTLLGKELVPVSISVAPSVIKIVSDSPQSMVDVEVRVRFLSFLGIGADVKTCGIIVHTAKDEFEAHCFYSNPSTGALCKAIEAACVLRYQKCLDAHHHQHGNGSGGGATGASSSSPSNNDEKVTSPRTANNLAAALKTVFLSSFKKSSSVEEK